MAQARAPRTDVGQTADFEQGLQRAVFAAPAVQNRKNRVETVGIKRGHQVIPGERENRVARAAAHRIGARNVAAIALVGNIETGDGVTGASQSISHGAARRKRNRAFGRIAAHQNGDGVLLILHYCISHQAHQERTKKHKDDEENRRKGKRPLECFSNLVLCVSLCVLGVLGG